MGFKQREHIFIFHFSQFYAKVSDYRAVGLSSHRHTALFNVLDSKNISVSSQNIHVIYLCKARVLGNMFNMC